MPREGRLTHRPSRSCSVSPQNIRQLFYPISFLPLQSFPQTVENCLICCLGLPIALGVHGRRVPISYPKASIVFSEYLAIKLQPIIQHQCPGDPKPCNNILLNEFFHIYIPNIRQGFNFHQFGKLICGHHHISPVPRSSRERTYYV